LGNFLLQLTFGAAAIVPVAGSIVNGPFGVEVNFTCPGSVDYGFAPFKNYHLSSTLTVLVPGMPDYQLQRILSAELTTIFEVTVLQFAGLFTSQIV
jgi:hypothetical protein